MQDDFLNHLSNVNMHTALLESLDWDEEALDRLIDYLNLQSALLVTKDRASVLKVIEKDFGEETSKVVENIFNDMIFKYNLHNGDQNYEN